MKYSILKYDDVVMHKQSKRIYRVLKVNISNNKTQSRLVKVLTKAGQVIFVYEFNLQKIKGKLAKELYT